MKSLEEIEFGSLGLVSTTQKEIDSSPRYDALIPQVNWQDCIERRNGSVFDIVQKMLEVIFRYQGDTKLLAEKLRADSIFETSSRLWNFWYHRCPYKEDEKGLEQLRRPARSYWEGALPDHGIDCDDFAIAVSSCLVNLKIPHKLRIARYPFVPYFQHVYVVVPDQGSEIIIDCVLDSFNTEKPTAEHKDFIVMDKNNFSGIDIAVLSGTAAPLERVITGSDFSGLGQISSRDKELQAVYNHLISTRAAIAENPELVKEVEDPKAFVKMLNYAIKYWNTDKRDEALRILSEEEGKMNGVHSVGSAGEEEKTFVQLQTLSDGSAVALGKIEWVRKFFTQVKTAAQKAGQGIKEAAKAVVKYNPLSVAARAGVLLALKVNLFHMGEHLKWGYLSETEARNAGFDMDEWRKVHDALQNTEHMFVDELKGKPENLRQAILSGRAGKLNGITPGALGIEPVSTATSTAASVPFITKIKNFISKINLKKLLQKVDVKKLLNKTSSGDSGTSRSAADNSTDNTTTQTPPDDSSTPPPDDGGTNWIPLAVIGGGLAFLFFSGEKKEKRSAHSFSGVGKSRGKKKKHGKKRTRNLHRPLSIPERLVGTHGSYTPAQHKRRRKHGAKGKHKHKTGRGVGKIKVITLH